MKRILLLLALSITVFTGLYISKATALNIAQGYHTSDASIGVGMGVAMSKDSTPDNPKVELSKRANIENFVGIVTTVEDTLLASPQQNSDVLVANSGTVTAFMTDLNGQIKKGDLLTVSPLGGMLMKAGDDDTFVVGTAIEDASSVIETKEVTTDQNNKKTVIVSSQKVDLQPHFRDVIAKKDGTASFLVIFGESITGGKRVSQTQVIVALILFFIVLAVEGSIIYGAVQSSVGAIGRNPLAKKAVYKQLLQVSWLSLIILTFGFGAIFLVLWI
jgi:hypothetical protein